MEQLKSDALQLAKQFCEYDLVRRDAKAAADLCTQDVHWFGARENEDVTGLEAVRRCIAREIEGSPEPYRVEYLSQQQQGDAYFGVALLLVKVSSSTFSISCRMSVSVRSENGADKICSLHLSLPTPLEGEHGYYPAVITQQLEQRMWNKLLDETLTGGMMTTFFEPGFPFYSASKKMLAALGYENQQDYTSDIKGLVSNGIHPDDLNSITQKINEQLAEGELYSVCYRMRKKDGTYLWVQDYGRVLPEADGRKVLAAVIYDVTEQKQAEQALHDTLQKTQAIIDAIPGGVSIYRISDVFTLTYCSEKVPALGGYTAEEYRKLNEEDSIRLVYPDDRELVSNALRIACTKGTVADCEFRKVHRDGHLLWIHLQGQRVGEENGLPLVQCVFHDITETKQSEALNEHLVNSISDGFGVYQLVDGMLKTLRYSNRLRELTGHTEAEYDECVENNLYRIVYEGDRQRLMQELAKASQADEVFRGSFRLVHKNGSLVGVHVNAQKIGQQDGKPIWYAIFMGMSRETGLYQDIADRATNGIYVIRKADHKLLYVNSQLAQTLKQQGVEDFLDKNCHDALRRCGIPCRDCPVFNGSCENTPQEVYIPHLEKYFSVVSHSLNWDGVPAYVVYLSDISEEKRTNVEIQNIYNNIPGAVFQCRFDPDWTVISSNDGLFNFSGYSREEFVALGNRMSAVIYPEDLAIMTPKIVAQLNDGKRIIENENRLICRDGTIKWISIRAQLMENPEGERFFYCVFVDITKQKEIEGALVDSRENLDIAMHHAGIYYWDYDCIHHTALFPKPVQELFQTSAICENYPEGFVALGFVAPAYRQLYCDSVRKLSSETPYVDFEAQINSAEGKFIWYRIRITGILGTDGTLERAVCTAEPISEYKNLEQKFLTVLAQNNITSWLYNIKKHTMPWTQHMETVFGPHDGDMENVPQSLIDSKVVHPDDIEAMRKMYRALDEGQSQVVQVLRMYDLEHKNYRWKRCTYTAIPDKRGQYTYALGSSVDVTEQMEISAKYEEALSARRKNIDENMLLAGHCDISKNRIVELEDRTGLGLLERFGSAREDFFTAFGRMIPNKIRRESFYHLFLREGLEQDYALGIAQHLMDFELNLDGDARPMRWVSARINLAKDPESGDLIGFIAITDITSSKMQAQVLDATVRFDYDYVARLDLNAGLMVMYQSKGVGEQLDGYKFGVSYPYEQAVIHTTEHYIIDEDKQLFRNNMAIENLRKQLHAHDVYEFTYRIREYNGELRTKRSRLVAYDRDAKIVVLSRVDVTALVEEQNAQKQALTESLALAQKANRAKSDFLSSMSHDIRTPMNAIVGMCDLAIDDPDNAAQVKESLNIIKSSSGLLLSLINDILDMSRIESGKMTLAEEGFSVREQGRTALSRVKSLVEKKHLHLESSCTISHDGCIGDVMRIHRAVGNILSNAIKFTPENGTIRCSITETATKNNSIGLYRFIIADTGIGMTPEQQAHVFEPFYRVETSMTSGIEGTGLGLPIAKNMVDYMGGTLSMESTPGVGTTFTIDLPLRFSQDSSTAAAVPQEKLKPGSLAGIHVLLCEDHPVNQKVATRILEKVGINVTVAGNGQIGYDLFTASEPDTFDAILMDIQMPVMNGYEATKAIRESAHPQAKSIPILAMTANAFAEDIQKCLSAGMDDHLAKPIEPPALFSALDHYLNHVPARAPQKTKILVVDDVEVNAAVLVAALGGEYEVLMASGGQQALDLLNANPDIAALITDIVMPGIDGPTLIRTVRADSRYANLAILANTQYGDPEQEEQLLQIGADDFLYKPTTPQVVQNRLHSVLRNYRKY